MSRVRPTSISAGENGPASGWGGGGEIQSHSPLEGLIYSFSQMLKHNFRNHARFSPNCKHKLQLSKTISQNFGFLLQKQTIASKQFYVCSKPNSILKSETTQSNEITNEAVSKHYTKKWKAQLSDVYMSFFTALNMHFQLKKAKLLMYMYGT